MIEIKNLNKNFVKSDKAKSTVEVLRDINVSIKENEFITIVGPSGCGKTTLLRIIAGLIMPNSGSVEVGGKRVEGPSPERAMVFQTFALMPWASALRNVAFGLEIRGVGKETRNEVAMDLLEKVGLKGFESALPSELSGGMRQRVGLARALAVNPTVLLMDEPFGGLDEQTKRLMQEELLRIWELEKKTVVFVTHSLDEAILLADRCILMSARPGQINKILNIDLGRPRTRDAELNPKYAAFKKELWEHLRQAQVEDETLMRKNI